MQSWNALVTFLLLTAILSVAAVNAGTGTDTRLTRFDPPSDREDRDLAGTAPPRVRPDPRHRAPAFHLPHARPLGLTVGEDPEAQPFLTGTPGPTALAAGDFDADGTPDLVCGYASHDGGLLTLHRGNPRALFPHDPREPEQPAFLSPGRVFAVPQAPDSLYAGDFDGDGRTDLVAATQGSNSLWVLPGDGEFELATARRVNLPGQVTAFLAGEINRADGLLDLVVGTMTPQGPEIAVFEGPQGALAAEPERVTLPAPATALALGRMDDAGPIDLVVGAGRDVWILPGRDRRLSLDTLHRRSVGPPRLERLASFETPVRAVATGDFVWDTVNRPEIAVLTDDGSMTVFGYTGPREWSELGRSLPLDALIGRASLVTARISGLPLEEVVAFHPATRTARLFLGEVRATTAPLALGEPLVADLEREPVAVLPMRLNPDAQHDLVVLYRDDPQPRVMASSFASTFTVTNTNDSGGGSLRTAINDANGSPGADLIDFAISVGGAAVIRPATPLPAILEAVTIDGYTQYDALPNTAPLAEGSNAVLKVVVDGGVAGIGAYGIDLAGGGSTVRGLVVQRFDADGIRVRSNGNLVEGNFVGVNFEGTTSLANENGVRIDGAADNTVGGTAPAARNLISGNDDDGIDLRSAGAGDNRIQGNLIGVDRLGTGAVPNGSDGIQVGSVIAGNAIGGTQPGAGNIISGNSEDGIDLYISDAITVQGNLIGVTADGSGALGNGDQGIQIESPSVTVGGTATAARNVISDNANSGVAILTVDATQNFVQGNLVGTDSAGAIDLGNQFVGVLIQGAPDNVVGGTAVGAGNLVSNNSLAGVSIQFETATGNLVQGNRIGTDAAGVAALPNIGEGVRIISAPGNEIGGLSPAAGNLISGNTASGLLILGQLSNGNEILGNRIGSDISGTADLGNGGSGVYIYDATGNTIGDPVAGNLISGNDGDGVLLQQATTTTNRIVGNRIGTDLAGEAVLGNALAGVRVTHAANNDIGGPLTGEGNVIADSGTQGVVLDANVPPGTGNRILGNSVFANASLGIDLADDGVSPNDPGDVDTGPNQRQNFPTVTDATLDGSNNVTIVGTLSAEAAAIYRLEFFSSMACDGTGHGEGRYFLGSTIVTTSGGSAGFNVTLANPVVDANTITGTATDTARNTSEFSPCETAVCSGVGSVFGPTVYAADKDTLSWGVPADVRWVKGNIYTVRLYSWFWNELLLAASDLDISVDNPGPGGGLYYLVRNAVCGSWQTTPGGEPGRDAGLP